MTLELEMLFILAVLESGLKDSAISIILVGLIVFSNLFQSRWYFFPRETDLYVAKEVSVIGVMPALWSNSQSKMTG